MVSEPLRYGSGTKLERFRNHIGKVPEPKWKSSDTKIKCIGTVPIPENFQLFKSLKSLYIRIAYYLKYCIWSYLMPFRKASYPYMLLKSREKGIKNIKIFWFRNQNEKSRDLFILVPEPFRYFLKIMVSWP